MSPAEVVFIILSVVTLVSASVVAFSRNIVYSAFSLLFTLVGVAGLYVLLSNDFLAAVQLIVYVGGILVLIIFAVFLTSRLGDVHLSNQSLNVFWGALISIGVLALIAKVIMTWPWTIVESSHQPMTSRIGNALLSKYLLPFEVVSVVLVITLIGAVVIARQEVRSQEKDK
jgi:NADH-quinone oxidoreductase subunit J